MYCMKPENPLFDNSQFESAISKQDQRERVDQIVATVLGACKGGAITQDVDFRNYYLSFTNYRYGQEAAAIPHMSKIVDSMHGYEGQKLRFAPIPHDRFEWQGMVAGESYFAIFEPSGRAYMTSMPGGRQREYDVLRLVNTPAGHVAAVDERGLYIARRRDSGEVTAFKLVDNPKYNQEVTNGDSLVDDSDRVLVRQVATDKRRFIPMLLTPQEMVAANDELELAAGVLGQSTPQAE